MRMPTDLIPQALGFQQLLLQQGPVLLHSILRAGAAAALPKGMERLLPVQQRAPARHPLQLGRPCTLSAGFGRSFFKRSDGP